RGEREAPAALDDLGDAVDVNDAVVQLGKIVGIDWSRHQNFKPPSRAPSATAAIRPWYMNPLRSNTTAPIFFSWHFFAISLPTSLASSFFLPLPSFSSGLRVLAAAIVLLETSSITCA